MGSEEPLVERSGVVVAPQVRDLKVEVGQGVGAVDDDRDPVAPGHVADRPDREDLPGEIDHVTHEDQAGPRGDALLEQPHDLVHVLRGGGDLDLP